MNKVIISAKEALEKGLKRYFTGKECSNGHLEERFVSSRICCECNRIRQRDFNSALNEEQIKLRNARQRVYYANMPIEQRERNNAKQRVENNLQILAAFENRSKSNLHWPDMG